MKTRILSFFAILFSLNLVAQSGQNDFTFNHSTGTNNTILATQIQNDGKIIVGGSFTMINGKSQNRLARLHADGTLDESFLIGNGFNNSINAIQIQNDGKIIIGGVFTSFNGILINRIIRLNDDGTIDPTFNSGTGFNGAVNTVAIQTDGKIIIGGAFTFCNGTSKNRLARLNADGSIDGSFLPGTAANNIIYTCGIQPDGKIILGGSFTNYSGVARNRVVRINADGSLDLSFIIGSGSNNSIRTSVIQPDGKILIGGNLTMYNGTVANRVARLNADGTIDGSFISGTGANGIVYTMGLQTNGKIVLGGAFTTFNGVASNRVIQLNNDGSADANFTIGIGSNNIVYCNSIQTNGSIVLGGKFTTFKGITRNRIVRIENNGNLDVTVFSGFGANNTVNISKVQPDGKIIIGGVFTLYNGVARNRIARLLVDGTLDTTFVVGTGANGSVNTCAIQSDGKIIIGGTFTSFNGFACSRVARLNADGSFDTSFSPLSGANNSVFTCAIQSDGKIILGGAFTTFDGIVVNRLVRLNSNGLPDISFYTGTSANNSVNSIAIQTDGKILIGGNFTLFSGVSRKRIARINSDGSLDATFNASIGANNQVKTIVIQPDGYILIGGNFTLYDNLSMTRIGRLNPNGSIDNTFNSGTGANGIVNACLIQSNNQIAVGGAFTAYNGVSINRVLLLNPNGTLDSNFIIGSGPNKTVNTVAIQNTGKLIIGGLFTSYNATARNRISRISNCIVPLITQIINDSICDSGNLVLEATPSSGTVNWFSTLSGGIVLNSGNQFITPAINTTTSYFVEATGQGCTSPQRTEVIAYVITAPAVQSILSDGVCDAGIASMSALPSSGILNWYSTATGGAPFHSGNSFTTPFLTTSITYFLEANDGSCVAVNRTPISAVVYETPTVLSTSSSVVCDFGVANLSAVTDYGTINWYTAASGGTFLGTGTTFTTNSIASNTLYYAEANNGGCLSVPRREVFVHVVATPSVINSIGAGTCNSGSVSLNATGSSGFLNWFPTATGGSAITTGSVFTTPLLTTTTLFYVEAEDSGCISAPRIPVTATIFTPPSAPNNISGPTIICSNTATNFSINPVVDAMDYTWSLPNGWSGNSTSEMINAVAGFNSGAVTVSANNACGSSPNQVINVTVPSIDNSVTLNQNNLTANQSNGQYQWLDCTNGNNPISGANLVSFNPPVSGSYAVSVTVNGCVETSICTEINVSSIEESTNAFQVICYPNPIENSLSVSSSTYKIVALELMDVNGKIVYTNYNINTFTTELDVSDLSSGLYFLQVISDKGKWTQKVIKN